MDMRVILKDDGPGRFTVGVKTSTPADRAVVNVFYEEPGGAEPKRPVGFEPVFLKFAEAVAPVAGGSEWGIAHFSFGGGLTKDRVRFVRVVLVTDVARAEIR